MAIKKLIIFPFNGNGIEALDCFSDKDINFIGFIDDSPEKLNAKNNWPVFGREILVKHPDAFVLAVPGGPLSYSKREEHIQSLNIAASRFITIIHPSANIGKNVKIGMNCLILAGAVITSNAQIGNHVCILPNTVIHHDAVVHDYTLIGCNVAIAGGTTIGKNCYIGSGTNIINGISVGAYTLIGLGSNVLSGVPEYSKIAGNPARQIKSK
jgi:sugar O-acyltransferase (sialic acid O-acetyltransferase NeuD family)